MHCAAGTLHSVVQRIVDDSLGQLGLLAPVVEISEHRAWANCPDLAASSLSLVRKVHRTLMRYPPPQGSIHRRTFCLTACLAAAGRHKEVVELVQVGSCAWAVSARADPCPFPGALGRRETGSGVQRSGADGPRAAG